MYKVETLDHACCYPFNVCSLASHKHNSMLGIHHRVKISQIHTG